MQASFIICFHTRRIDNLLQTLRFLARNDFDIISRSEVFLMCQDRCGSIKTAFAKTHFCNMRLDEMIKNKMINRAATKAQSENLVILDSDRILPLNYFQETIANLQKGTVISAETIWNIKCAVSDKEIIDNNFVHISENKSKTNQPLCRCVTSGNFAIKKEDFWNCGGMDEEYIGYGFEDQDFAKQLEHKQIKTMWKQVPEFHLHHERLTYGKADQKKLFLDNALRYCEKWDIAVPQQIRNELDNYIT